MWMEVSSGKVLKCCSLLWVVGPAFQHDLIHFKGAHVWSSQCLVILNFECILNDLLIWHVIVWLVLCKGEDYLPHIYCYIHYYTLLPVILTVCITTNKTLTWMTFRNEERQKEQMVTQEGLLQLLAQMEEELEGRLPKIAVLRVKTDGEIKVSIVFTARKSTTIVIIVTRLVLTTEHSIWHPASWKLIGYGCWKPVN